MAVPTLHEIAAMPFPASRDAMRKFYNPNWGRPSAEDDGVNTYIVEVRWTASGYQEYTVEASDEDQAEAIAREKFDADYDLPDEAEWDFADVCKKDEAR